MAGKRPTTPEHPPRILVLDVATSTFKVQGSLILEVAAILVDAPTLDVIDTATWVIKHPEIPAGSYPDFHSELVQLCLTSPTAVSLARCEGELIAGPWAHGVQAVCNRHLYFDREFFKHHMPNFAKYIPRAELDINGLEVLARARGVGAHMPSAARTYRAGDDAVDAYEALMHYSHAAVGK